jgi:hypothetical protein
MMVETLLNTLSASSHFWGVPQFAWGA